MTGKTGKRVIERNMFYGAKKSIFLKAVELRKNLTPAEKVLWEKLCNKKILNVRFKCQHPIDIFIADFYCHKLRMVVEVDGEIHENPERMEYDLARAFELNKYGIKIIRFSNKEVIENIENVIERIKTEILSLSPL
jgi:very-short-patch-repair endonuclease